MNFKIRKDFNFIIPMNYTLKARLFYLTFGVYIDREGIIIGVLLAYLPYQIITRSSGERHIPSPSLTS